MDWQLINRKTHPGAKINFEYCGRMPVWQLCNPKLSTGQVQDRDQLHLLLPPSLRKSGHCGGQQSMSLDLSFHCSKTWGFKSKGNSFISIIYVSLGFSFSEVHGSSLDLISIYSRSDSYLHSDVFNCSAEHFFIQRKLKSCDKNFQIHLASGKLSVK